MATGGSARSRNVSSLTPPTSNPVMRAKLADAYSQAGGDDEKAARILGACLGSARLAKRRQSKLGASLSLSSRKKMDAHCFPLHLRKCELSKATFFSRWQRLSSCVVPNFFNVLWEPRIICD
jgi:hypothetical protein